MKKAILSKIILTVLLFSCVSMVACNEQTPKATADTTTQGVSTEATTSTTQEQPTAQPEQTTANADVAEPESLDFEFTLLSDDTYAVSKLLNTEVTDIAVPAEYCGKPVTKILLGAFKNATHLTSLVLPDTLLEIEKNALFGCSSLEEITLPFVGSTLSSTEPLGYIFGKAFYPGAQKATQSFFCPDGLVRYDDFYIPSALKKVTVIGGVIHMYSFEGCAMIKELVFDDGVTAIESGAFFFCDRLETVSMGASITEISDECFFALTSLKKVTIGKNVTKIGYNAFSGCTSIKRIVIPKKVSLIEKYAFYNCTGMESIVFENTSGWYRDYGSASGTGMDVTNPGLNAKNLTDGREYSSDRWKRR